MKIAVQLPLLPGDTARDQAKWARDHGVEAIELNAWGVGFERLRREAEEVRELLPISSVCANADLHGHPSFDFLDPDPAKRMRSRSSTRRECPDPAC